jgi:DNA repair protein RecO (recombination protein O)
MRTETVQVIVLSRTNYGEADRIVNVITNNGQKISLIVKGVRKLKSKLVAAAELFTISEVSYVVGKSDLYTVSSAKIVNQYGNFLNDLDKVQLAFSIVKNVNKNTRDTAGTAYFNILKEVFEGLNNGINPKTVELWANCNMLKESGHSLRLNNQINNEPFAEDHLYMFDFESGGFIQADNGVYRAEHVKLLKLSHSQSISVLGRVNNCENLSIELNPFIKQFVEATH